MRIEKLMKLFGVDFHISLTLLQRGWGVLAGGITVLFVPLWFGRVEQGYYYTFSTLIALQIFFELGFNYVVVQLVGHESANLKVGSSGHLIGDVFRINRLSSLVLLLKRWYAVAAGTFFIIAGLVGFAFFRNYGDLSTSAWGGAWLLQVLCAAANLYLSPFLAVLEGCGNVGNVARLRLVQSMAGYSFSWIALFSGVKLWAVPIPAAIAVICTYYWLHVHDRILRKLVEHKSTNTANRVRWREEIFPFQWRIALSWISGYFIFYVFTPMVFAKQGAIEGGRIGMTLTIFNTLLTLGISWVNAKAPIFAGYIARKERSKLNQLFLAVTKRSVIFVVVASVALVSSVYVLNSRHVAFAQRVASPTVFLILAFVTVANTLVYAAATYMRAHKEEPLIYEAICVGILTVVGIYVGARHSVLMAVIMYGLVNVAIGVPWTARLFVAYYRRVS